MPGARRLTVGDQSFLWTMRWSHDRDGERIVHLAVGFAEGERRRGQYALARFFSRRPEYPAPTCVALPGDARAVVDFARAQGWTGKRSLWLLPGCGLERPDLVLATPTRLREWARARPLYVAHPQQRGLGGPLAAALGVPPVPESVGGAELQWRDPRYFILDGRHGGMPAVHSPRVADLAAAIRALHRLAPNVGTWVRGLPATGHGPGPDQTPAPDILGPAHWTTVRGPPATPACVPRTSCG